MKPGISASGLCLRLLDGVDQLGQTGWVSVTDRYHFKIGCAEGHDVKSRVIRGRSMRFRRAGFFRDEHRDPVPADAVEQLRDWLVVQIGQVRPFQGSVRRQVLWEVEAEG